MMGGGGPGPLLALENEGGGLMIGTKTRNEFICKKKLWKMGHSNVERFGKSDKRTSNFLYTFPSERNGPWLMQTKSRGDQKRYLNDCLVEEITTKATERMNGTNLRARCSDWGETVKPHGVE